MQARPTAHWRAAALSAAALFLSCLPAVALLGLAGCGNPMLKGGVLHFDAARYEKAAEVFSQAVAQNPGNSEAHLWLARAYSELDSVPQAIIHYERAVTLNPSLEPVIEGYRAHYWRRHLTRGESYLREALAMDRTSPQRAGRLTTAAEALDNAEAFAPENALTYYQLYRLDMARGDSTGAQRNLTRAADRGRDDPEVGAELAPVFKERGRAAVLARRYSDAIADYNVAARFRPGDVDVMIDLASAYLLQAEDPTAGEDQVRKGLDEAGLLLEKVRRLRPYDPDALFNLATIRARTGRFASADTLVRVYLSLKPRDPDAYHLLEDLAKALGREETARTAALAGRALSLDKPVGDTPVWARRAAERFGPASDLGRFYASMGPPDEIDTVNDGGNLTEIWIYSKKQRVAAFQDGAAVGDVISLEGGP